MEQLDEGIKFIDAETASKGKEYELDVKALDEVTGVGVVVTLEQIQATVKAAFDANKDAIMT